MRMYIVMYDICDEKRLQKICKTLKAYGVRIQRSVFQTKLTDFQKTELVQKLTRLIKADEDQILLFKIGKAEKEGMIRLGCQLPLDEMGEDYYL